jgi:hypothetical protein
VTTVTADDDNEIGLLSSRDRSVIRKTWDQAKKDGDVPPQILYRYASHPSFLQNLNSSLFMFSFPSFIVAHPEYQKMFKSFATVPQNELLGNGNFLAQAYTILAGLNVVIQSLSSQELLANQINALGGAHDPRGTTPIMFEVCIRNKIG